VEKNYALLFPEPRICECVKRDALFRDRAKGDVYICDFVFKKPRARCHVITHVLSVSRPACHPVDICAPRWFNQADFQLNNINPSSR
jgi:hypothetical protein